MRLRLKRYKIALAWLAVATIGILAGAWGYYDARIWHINDIKRAARGAALVMTVSDVSRLTGTPADEGTDYYKRVKARLAEMHNVLPLIHCVFVFRFHPGIGKFVCLADSLPVSSPERTRPGDELIGSMRSDRAPRTLREGVVTYNESYTDMLGVWVVAYARIEDGEKRNLIRLDMDMRGWRMDLLMAALERALYAWLLLGAPLAIYTLMKRYLKQSRFIQQLRAAVEQSPVAMVILDTKGTIVYVNEALCNLSKYNREEIIGKHWTATTEGLDKEKLDRLKRVSDEGKMWIDDFELERKNGIKYIGRIMNTPVRNESGKVIACISIVTDMTEITRRAEELRSAKERAEAADKAKSIFLATMSHEVRTPLNGILGFSDLLIDTDMTPEQREYVHAIHSSGELLLRLTENILDFTRIEAGHMKIARDIVDVRDLADSVLGSIAPRAASKNLRLLKTIAPDVPSQVLADSRRLRQVLVNLVGNAIKFTPSGEIEVLVRTSQPPQPPATAPGAAAAGGTIWLEFAVRDTGIGIERDEQEQLFRPFMQLDSSIARQYEGAGLGLAISYDLVRLMGGSGISVESKKNQGSTFSFVICCGTAG